MYSSKNLIKQLGNYTEEINNLLNTEKNVASRENEKLEAEKGIIDQFVTKLKQLPEEEAVSSKYIEKELHLFENPEGGFYREIIRINDYTVIFYLLHEGEVSTWHALKDTEEIWKLLAGGFLTIPRINAYGYWQGEELLTFEDDVTILRNKNGGFGDWFGAYSREYSLVTCRCIPPFEFSKFAIAQEKDLILFRENNKKNPDCERILSFINRLSPKFEI